MEQVKLFKKYHFQISYVSITIKIVPDEAVVFAVAIKNNNIQEFPISMETDTLEVLAEEGSEIEIPGGAFSSETSLSLEVSALVPCYRGNTYIEIE